MIHALGIIWNPSEGIDLGFFTIRFYSLMFVIAFVLGWYITKPIFIRENEPLEKLDSIFVWVVVATLLGARLGHVIFYQQELFTQDPLSILLPIRTKPEFQFTGFSGLASHGATLGIIIAMYFFSKKVMKRSILWILDRINIPVALGAIFVRFGNFFNSEIFGNPTSGDNFYGVKFVSGDDYWMTHSVNQITNSQTAKEGYKLIANDPQFANVLAEIPFRHPAQLYEALGYFFVFLIVYFTYWKTKARKKEGFILGLFLVILFGVRMIVETVKASQGGFENNLGNVLSTGQWLSIPFIIAGIILMLRAKEKQTL
jgi:phosphatidylglycerol---prolipoprotein diacylglyceryl transferase